MSCYLMSDLIKNIFFSLTASSAGLLQADLASSTKISALTKMTFSNSIQLKMIKKDRIKLLFLKF